MLRVEGLTVNLGGEDIIKELSFEIKKGDIVTILGPNGAGKSVLFKTLIGSFDYRGVIEWGSGVKVGYVPQRLPFIKEMPMSVSDFLKLKKGSPEEMRETLASVGFSDDLLDKRIGDLSSGQFQRVLIAWALIGNPNLLLFDEPTTGVDIASEETIYALLERLHRDRDLTIMMITHDLSVVFKFSNFVICLNRNGTCQGAPKDVLSKEALQELYGDEVRFYQHKR